MSTITLPREKDLRPSPMMTANRDKPTERNADGWCFDDLETYRSYVDSPSGADPLAASILCRAVAAESARDALAERLVTIARLLPVELLNDFETCGWKSEIVTELIAAIHEPARGA